MNGVDEPRISVIAATYNRLALLRGLLDDLAAQTLPPDAFEVIVVDDGSVEAVPQSLDPSRYPYHLVLERQANAGPAAARHLGATLSRAPIIVFIDDDMQPAPDFLERHLEAHERGYTVVQGVIAPAAHLGDMPIFERFHAAQLDRFVREVEEGRVQVHGVDVCTGNVSVRRADYFAVGGFDPTLGRSEDRELGIRLEDAGAKLALATGAITTHRSDHDELDVWLRRAFNYGVFDRRIARKHPHTELADPWRFWFLVNPLSRPLLLGAVAMPWVGERLAQLSIRAAMLTDWMGMPRLAIAGTTLCYGLQYFRGMRTDAGSLLTATMDFAGYVRKRLRTRRGTTRRRH